MNILTFHKNNALLTNFHIPKYKYSGKAPNHEQLENALSQNKETLGDY